MSMTYLIGCGGVGSWLVPLLVKLQPPDTITLVDGDKLEEKNLDRQLFPATAIGQFKAESLARLHDTQFINSYYAMGKFIVEKEDWLLVVVDNHPGRLAALQECDSNGCRAIFAANETFSAEAFYYQKDWRGGPLDPRVYYPELLTNRDGDPRAAAIGCTGTAQTENRQLASANFMAASLLMHLLTVWRLKAPTLGKVALDHLPYKLICNLTRLQSYKCCSPNPSVC